MRRVLAGATLTVLILCATSANADISESEPNNTFGTRQYAPDGTTRVLGSLDVTYDFSAADSLAAGTVIGRSFSATAGAEFFAWIDNTVTGENPDTVMGAFSSAGTLVGYNDDDPRFGDGFASAVGGVVNPDGSIDLQVSGYPDYKFAGDHAETGGYELFVQLGEDKWVNDVDFFTFLDLVPGTTFTAEITESITDTVLGWFDDSGFLTDYDDDGGVSPLSKITGLVPGSGALTIAVSGWEDYAFQGNHFESGDYVLTLDAARVPEPATIVLLSIGGMLGGLVSWRRRRRSL